MLDLADIHGGHAVVVDEDRVRAMLLLAGWVRGAARADSEVQNVLDRLADAGLPVAIGERGERRYDAYQVVNAVRWAGRAHARGLDEIWRERFVATARHTAASFDGASAPRRFELRIRRSVAVSAASCVTVRVPVPLDGGGQSDIEVEPASSIAGPLRRGDGWAEASVQPDACTADLEVTVRVTLAPHRPVIDPARIDMRDVDPADAELYTRPSEGLIAITPAIAALAHELAEHAPDPWTIVGRFWRFLFRRLRIGPIYHGRYGDDPLRGAIDAGWSDCYLGSSLLVALCRAVGLPARVVGGFFLYPTSPTNHFWTEVLLPPYGWVPLDLACWELAAGDPDDPWASHFLGKVDYRIVTERFPRQFMGRRGLRIPRDVVILQAATPTGAEVMVHGIAPHVLAYADRVAVIPDGGR